MLGLASLALGSISGLNQLLTARKQQRMADRIQATRPTYELSNELIENVATARNMANSNMPGMGNATNNIFASTASANRAAQLAGGSNNALAAIGAASANEANLLSNLADQNATYRTQMQGNLSNQLSKLAEEKRNQWQYNKADKYTEDSAAKSALTGAAMTNRHAGITGLSNLGMSFIGGLQDKNKKQNEQQSNNVSDFHRSQLNGFKSAPLFGGTLSNFPS
jgi:hypothetical protein